MLQLYYPSTCLYERIFEIAAIIFSWGPFTEGINFVGEIRTNLWDNARNYSLVGGRILNLVAEFFSRKLHANSADSDIFSAITREEKDFYFYIYEDSFWEGSAVNAKDSLGMNTIRENRL